MSKNIKGYRTVLSRYSNAVPVVGETTTYCAVNSKGITAEVEARYWTTGCESGFHQICVVALVNDREVFKRESRGFGYPSRRAAVSARARIIEDAFVHLRALLAA